MVITLQLVEVKWLTADAATGDQAQVFLGVKLLAAQQIGGPESAGLEVVAKVEMLSFAGPVFDHGGGCRRMFPSSNGSSGPMRCWDWSSRRQGS